MRLVDRIARPSPVPQKAIAVKAFDQKLQALNKKMQHIRS